MSLPRFLLILLLFGFEQIFCGAATTNINCVGDSITAGVGLPATQSYPAKLQQLLGPGYAVNNFGISGTTLLKNGDMPYWNQTAFALSQNRPKPNIVIIMLGSNDSKSQNWVYGSNFISDYNALIAVYTNISPTPRILLCTPPPVFNNGTAGINPGIVATNITPLVLQIGASNGLQVVDMQTLLAGHSEWFPDNVHPNSSGTTVMAAILYSALRGDTMNGSTPGLTINTLSSSNMRVSWPAAGAGWVLQSVSAVEGASVWPVVNLPAINDGTMINVTNPIVSQSGFFRLWQPSN